MYLLLSIAAADLCGGWALALEGRGSGDFAWFTRRRVFGVSLIVVFVLLVGASIRVLFYSSIENVELVLGAAAVLFVADVVSVGREESTSVMEIGVQGEFRVTVVWDGEGRVTAVRACTTAAVVLARFILHIY